MRYIIYPYNIFSQSAKAISGTLDGIRVYPDKNYIPKIGDVVINWGASKTPKWLSKANAKNIKHLNHHTKIRNASDKIKAFKIMKDKGVAIPEVTQDLQEAKGWNSSFIGRTIINGHGGAGCFFYRKGAVDFEPEIKFCTKYIKKTSEYRVHVFNGKVIDIQEKRKRVELPEDFKVNYQIRNHDKGWVFCRENVNADAKVGIEAVKAVKALSLLFGAVDIIWNKFSGAWVLEVNTSPGLEGTTLTKYKEAIEGYIGEMA